MKINDLITRWQQPDGHPYKGKLIDYAAAQSDPDNIGCMCAQGQVLHLLAGWSFERLRDAKQADADAASAEAMGISRAHAVLLRTINDGIDGAPSIVITHPEKVLGDQAQTVLAFWHHLDLMTSKQWAAARDAAWDAARDAAGAAAWDAAWDAARDAAGAAARDAAWDAAGAAARDAARDAAGASNEIQGAALMRERGQSFYFLPMFGFADPEAVLAADRETNDG